MGAASGSGPRRWQAHAKHELGCGADRRVKFQHSEESCFSNCVLNWAESRVPRLVGNGDLRKGLYNLEEPDAPSAEASEEGKEVPDAPSAEASEEGKEVLAPLRALRNVNDFINFCRRHTKAYGIGASKVKTAGGGEGAWHEHFLSFLFEPATRASGDTVPSGFRPRGVP